MKFNLKLNFMIPHRQENEDFTIKIALEGYFYHIFGQDGQIIENINLKITSRGIFSHLKLKIKPIRALF